MHYIYALPMQKQCVFNSGILLITRFSVPTFGIESPRIRYSVSKSGPNRQDSVRFPDPNSVTRPDAVSLHTFTIPDGVCAPKTVTFAVAQTLAQSDAIGV